MDMVLWKLGELQPIDPSDLPDIQLTVNIDSTFSGMRTFLNKACLSWAKDIDLPAEVCSETIDTIGSPPKLTCSTKGRDFFAQAGGEIHYLIQCENSGWSAAHSLVITDSIPEHTEYVTCRGVCQYDSVNKVVSWNVEQLEREEEKIFSLIVYVECPLASQTPIINKIWLTCAEGLSASDAETTIAFSIPVWDLSMSTFQAEVFQGKTVTFTIRLRNAGNTYATNTVVTNRIPEYTSYSSNTGGGVFEMIQNRVTWDLGTVHVNEEREISLTVIVDSNFSTEREVVNRVYVQSDERADSVSISLPLMLPHQFHVSQNYPNPFNQTTTITVQLPEEAFLDVRVYNILGQKIGTLVRGHRQAGVYTIQWDGRSMGGRDLTSGVYIYRVVVNNGKWSETRRMILLR